MAVRGTSKWRVRVLISLALIIPLYVLPLALWIVLIGDRKWALGILLTNAISGVSIGFLTNDYRFGIIVYLLCASMGLGFVALGQPVARALMVWNLLPALTAIYFAQQLVINAGD